MGRQTKKKVEEPKVDEIEKAEADKLAEQLIEKMETNENEVKEAETVEETETPTLETDTADEEKPRFVVYDHMVKAHGRFYNPGEKVPVDD